MLGTGGVGFQARRALEAKNQMRKTATKSARLLMAASMTLLLTTQVSAMEVPVSQTEQMVNGQQTLVKVFEVSTSTDPQTLVEQDLVQNGYSYAMTSIVKDVESKEVEKEITQEETVTISTSKEDDARVEALKSMPPFIEYDKDDFTGKLYPLVNTLELTETGRSSHSGSNKVTKTFTVDYNDESLIPGTISEDGKTYSRSSITWADGQYMEDSVIPENYIATATYSKPYSYTTVDGYEAKMTYTGEVKKVSDETASYTLTYIGTPLEVGPEGMGTGGKVALGAAAGAGVLVLCGAGLYVINRKKHILPR